MQDKVDFTNFDFFFPEPYLLQPNFGRTIKKTFDELRSKRILIFGSTS